MNDPPRSSRCESTATSPAPRRPRARSEKSDFTTFRFTGNIIECIGTARPPFRNDAGGSAVIENNRLTDVTDTTRCSNQPTDARPGLEQPLKFKCGVNGKLTVDGWKPGKIPAK